MLCPGLATITTERLVLREIVESDFAAIHAYACDPDVCRFMSWGPNTADDTWGYIGRAAKQRAVSLRDAWTLAICLKDTRLIGGCGIHVTDPDAQQGFIGYTLHRAHWGTGYATECARALLRFGFRHVGLHRIWTDCDTQNLASARVLQKAGMRREATLRKNKRKGGEWRSSHIYAILAEEMVDG